MPRCCGSATCACVINEGTHIDIAGSGSAASPYVITADVGLAATDNSVFDVTIAGLGTVGTPWTVEVKYAATAKLNDLPDVTAASPTNGQVLGWDSATSQWTARAPTTAASGSVQHDTALTGDGSAGTPLGVNEDPARMLATAAGGLGLSDTGMNSIVRRFTNATTRGSASPAPVANALTMLDDHPGQIDYWTGSAWSPAGVFLLAMVGQQMWAQSGPYTGAERVTLMIRNVAQTTDSVGMFDAIPAVDLSLKAGVLTAIAQATAPGGPSSIGVPYSVILTPDAGAIRGVAYRLDDGQPLPLTPINCTVLAMVY